MMGVYELGDNEFLQFRQLIHQEAGINLSDMKKALVQARLARRLRALGLSSFKEYNYYLQNCLDDEIVNFINAITTNKTDFFRENKHFDFIREVILPEFDKRRVNEIRIWSAGCSSGEEPYTIAITLLDYYKNKRKPYMKILATDIDTLVLEKAKKGIYSIDQVEDIDRRILREYFYQGKGENEGFYKVKESLKNIIRFRRLNLQNQTFPMRSQFDIIFCRNVVIYFDRETQKSLFKKFHLYLANHGYLIIGHSENISSYSDDFKMIGNTIYEKVVK